MFRWITRRRPPSRPDSSSSPDTANRPDHGAPRPPAHKTEELERAFYSLLLGTETLHDRGLDPLERELCRDLDAIVSTASLRDRLLPGRPAILRWLFRGPEDDTVFYAELERLVSPTPAADGAGSQAPLPFNPNPAPDRGTDPLDTLTLRRLLARIAMQPLFNLRTGPALRRAGPVLRDQATASAEAAACLACKRGMDPFHAYVTGLVQNLGTLVVIRAMDRVFPAAQAPGSRDFFHRFTPIAQSLSWRIARDWGLPESVTHALEGRIRGDAQGSPPADLLIAADSLSKTHVLVQRSGVPRRLGSPPDTRNGPTFEQYASCYDELQEPVGFGRSERARRVKEDEYS